MNPDQSPQSSSSREHFTPDAVEGNHYYLADYYRDQLLSAAQEIARDAVLPEEVVSEAQQILLKGGIGEKQVGDERVARNGANEAEQRQYLAEMIVRDPESREAAKAIIENDVCGFHATDSVALSGILEAGGLRSTRSMRADGLSVPTGEHQYQPPEGQGSISFGNLARTKDILTQYAGPAKVVRKDHAQVVSELDVMIESSNAMDRATLSPREIANLETGLADFAALRKKITEGPQSLVSTMARVRFPVAFGVSRGPIDRADPNRLLSAASHLGEFRPAEEKVELSELPVVAVPREVVEPVKKLFEMFGYPDTVIVSLEALE